ncbi:MgtC/SapB family protein [Plastoroseomonas hellenica]|uniref:DUF4010 domain-containing protein n=1 Tax=Plastoroseomonas hellenica TaxID=2687306 RepID=A0ABS5F7A6_9PROT|nr:DUF4010 domain-containing protein [Plastoroseomonas hellenica]MBR0646420.1 DUF4010 domain-containing protein [Plastoroseomonas hellenica]MBR0668366.1 DUF4010 domain-containing protein [Plastoroseomonas hellenica]
MPSTPEQLWALATALGIGALIGLEREKRKAEDPVGAIGGLRTFITLALLGGAAGLLGEQAALPWIPAVVLAIVGFAVIASYHLRAREQVDDGLGLTSELAAIAVCLLGMLSTMGGRDVAAGLGVLLAALLAYKSPLHGLVRRIGWDDVLVVMRLGLASFVVLPLLPDRAIDPWGALNPYSLWLLALLIAGLSLAGYVAVRALGPGHGTAVTGLAGGLVSSTAVTLAFARRAAAGEAPRPLAAGILLAWAVMCGRVLVTVALINRALLPALAWPMALMGLAAVGFALWHLRGAAAAAAADAVAVRNPFSLTEATKFAALFAVVQLLVALARAYLPPESVLAVAALAGLTDVDAITLSMARQAQGGDGWLEVSAIVIACFANTLVKAGMATYGTPGMRGPVGIATVAILCAGVLGLLVTWQLR